MSETIYERKYPHKTLEEIERETEEWVKEHPKAAREESLSSFSEVYERIVKRRTLVPLPERIQRAEGFIRLAVKVGETYEINTKVEKTDSHISVEYSFDCGGMDYLIPVFRQADTVAFFTETGEFDITLVLDYYTHAVYQGKRLIQPYIFD